MRTPAQDLAAAWIAWEQEPEGVVHVAVEPPLESSPLVTMYDSGGQPPVGTFVVDETYVHVRVKDKDYQKAYEKAAAIRDWATSADGHPPSIPSQRYVWFGAWLSGQIQSIGRDDLDRHVLAFTLNLGGTAKSV